MRAVRPALAALLVVGFGTAAVGVATGGEGGTASNGPAEITLDDRRIEAPAAVRAGRVVFEERNDGGEAHDLVIVRTDRAPGDLPMGLDGVAPGVDGEVVLGGDLVGHAHDGGRGHDHLEPRATRSRAVVLAPGRYVVLCPLPGHYEAGERTALRVG